MKITLLGLLLVLSSFTIDQRVKPANLFYATVNGEVYRQRNKPYFEIAPVNSASIGSTNRTVLKLNFPGPVYTLRSNKQFSENLQLLIGYSDGVVDTNYFATLLYQGEYYYVLRDSSKLDVSGLHLNDKGLLISAKLNCTFRNYNNRLTGKGDIRVLVEMQELLLTNATNENLITSMLD